MLLKSRKIKTELEVEQDFLGRAKNSNKEESIPKRLNEIDKEVM
jgi:hypothetical protein